MDATLEAMIHDFYRETAEIQARNIRASQSLGLLRACDPLLTAYAHAYEGLRAPGAPSRLD